LGATTELPALRQPLSLLLAGEDHPLAALLDTVTHDADELPVSLPDDSLLALEVVAEPGFTAE